VAVGGRGEVGEQRQRLVGVGRQTTCQRGLVELTDVGRNVVEVTMASERPPGERAPSGGGDRRVSRGSLQLVC
jgi:hypothetical protein